MSRHEKARMSVEIQRELDAIDAALSGEAVAGAHVPLEELVRALQSVRPHPSTEFVQALDARAAHGFRRASQHRAPDSSQRAPTTERGRRRRRRTAFALPALGIAVAAVLVVVSLPGSGGGPRPQAGVASAPSNAVFGKAHELPGVGTARGTARAATAEPEAVGPAAPAAPGAAGRQVERTSTLDVGVAPGAVETTAQRVFTLVTAFNGYVRQSNVSSGAAGQGGASFDVRLPSSNLPAALAALSHLGRVRSETDTTNDVTEQLGGLQRTDGDLRAQRASLLRALAQAREPQQAASLKAQLHAVEARIGQVQRELRALTARIDYTRLALSLTPEVTGGATAGDFTPGGAAHDAARILSAGLAVLVIGAAAVLPLAAVLIAGWVAVSLTRRRLREQALDAG
jgi:hypothetical protein